MHGAPDEPRGGLCAHLARHTTWADVGLGDRRHNVALANKATALVTFNVVWFALPLAALLACIIRPDKALVLVGSVEQWTRDHARGILLTVSFGAGTALVIRGILTI